MRAVNNLQLILLFLIVHCIQIIFARYHNDNSNHHKHSASQKNRLQQQVDVGVPHYNRTPRIGIDKDLNNIRNVFQEKYLVLDAATGIRYNPYSKQHPGRHVCGIQKIQHTPEKVIQKSKQNDDQPCDKLRCPEVRTGDKFHSKDSKSIKQQMIFECCPGWAQISNKSYGCNKPVCSPSCQNGGICAKPNICSCPPGFTGRLCETDINECEIKKPCDHICYNSVGSFECHCKENFALQADGQSCIKEVDDLAIESDHFEYHMLDERLQKLEILVNSSKTYDELLKEIQQMKLKYEEELTAVEKKIIELESFYAGDLSQLKNKLSQLEKKSIKIDELSIKYDKIKRCGPYSKKYCF